MRRSTLFPAAALAPAYLLACTLTVGCAPEEDDDVIADPAPAAGDAHADHDDSDHADHDHADHDHPAEGPHGGSLIELGDEEYHGELLHDAEAGTVTVYLLDSTAKLAATTDATEATVNLSHDGERKAFTLTAEPQEGDAEGRSSKFVNTTDAALGEELDHGHDDAKLMLKIDGTAFSGSIRHSAASHDEDHDGHDNDGHDNE